MRRAINALLLAILIPIAAGSLIAAVAVGTWVADRRDPLRIERVRVLTPEVGPAGFLQVEFRVTYLRNCKIHADRWMTDTARHRRVLDDTDFERPPGEIGTPQTFIMTVEVPSFFTDGPALYQTRPWYACNPLHQYIWPLTPEGLSIPFMVRTPGT